MTNQTLHLIKNMARNQKEINEVEKEIYDLRSREKTLMESNNHLLTELIKQVQIDCNLNDEIKESLITEGVQNE